LPLHPDVPTGQQVVDHVHLREQLDVLERAGDAELATLSGRSAHDRLALERMSPCWGRYTWLIVLKIDVLPGAVRSDDGEQLAGLTSKPTPLIAVTPPNRRVMSSTSISGAWSCGGRCVLVVRSSGFLPGAVAAAADRWRHDAHRLRRL
jgi:hypothetical protein